MRIAATTAFEFFIGKRGRRWLCLVFPNVRKMWAFAWGLDQNIAQDKFSALCMARHRVPRSPYRGLLLFSETRLDAGIVTHECVHAALRSHGLGGGKPLDDKKEETVCGTAGDLSGEFWTKLRKLMSKDRRVTIIDQ
jgi:hypothetical protein